MAQGNQLAGESASGLKAALALRLVSPEVAVQRVQTSMKLRGWPTEAMERFVLVPSPSLQPSAGDQDAVA